MFPRSERFVEKIEITPGPGHYDVKLSDDDPYKRFGFLGKTKRFNESNPSLNGGNPNNNNNNYTNQQHNNNNYHQSPYERNSLSVSLPSLIIDDESTSPDTASVHSNGSITPDMMAYGGRRPSATARSKSSDKLGTMGNTHQSKVEERLKRELSELTEKFEKYRLSHQKDLDGLAEKQKKGEALYQGCIKEKNSILTQLAAKESEIAELGARHTMLKASLEKSEKAAALVTEKLGKSAQLQKKIEELERLHQRSKQALVEQEITAQDLRKKLDQERQQLLQQLSQQQATSLQETTRLQEEYQARETQYRQEIKLAQADSDQWRLKVEALEQRIKELERLLEIERNLVKELQAKLKQEQKQFQTLLDQAHGKLLMVEKEKAQAGVAAKDTIQKLLTEKVLLENDFAKQSEVLKEERWQLQETAQQQERSIEALKAEIDQAKKSLQENKNQSGQRIQELEKTVTQAGQECSEKEKIWESEKARIEECVAEQERKAKELDIQLSQYVQERKVEQEASTNEVQQLEARYLAIEKAKQEHEESSSQRIRNLEETVAQADKEYSENEKVWASERARIEEQAVESERMVKELELQLSQSIQKRKVEAEASVEQIQGLEARCEAAKKEHTECKETFAEASRQFSEKEQTWVSEKARIEKCAAERETMVKQLEIQLNESIQVRQAEAEANTDQIQELEAKCLAMESAIQSMYESAGSKPTGGKDHAAPWQQHATSVLATLADHSILCTQHQALVQESAQLQESLTVLQASAQEHEASAKKAQSDHTAMETKNAEFQEDIENLSTQVETMKAVAQEQEAFAKEVQADLSALLEKTAHLEEEIQQWKLQVDALEASAQAHEAAEMKAQSDHSALLAKIAELEEEIQHLKVQVDFLEAENIGKVAIVKALQDEYDYQEKVIRDLSKNEDSSKEVIRLEDELRTLTNHTREMDEWIKNVQADVEKYKVAYIKADVSREETLLDMGKLHEELAESEAKRLEVENQLQVEVNVLIKRHDLSTEELTRLSKMNADSAQNQSLKQKVKQLAVLKEENLALKKKNLNLSNTRDSLRLKCLQVERELESHKAVAAATAATTASSNHRQSISSSSGSGSVTSSSSSSALLGGPLTLHLSTSSEQLAAMAKQQQQYQPMLSSSSTITRPRSMSTVSIARSTTSQSSARSRSSTLLSNANNGETSLGSRSIVSSSMATKNVTSTVATPLTPSSCTARPPLRSRAARSYMAGQSTAKP